VTNSPKLQLTSELVEKKMQNTAKKNMQKRSGSPEDLRTRNNANRCGFHFFFL
jgi:hypothetical protein